MGKSPVMVATDVASRGIGMIERFLSLIPFFLSSLRYYISYRGVCVLSFAYRLWIHIADRTRALRAYITMSRAANRLGHRFNNQDPWCTCSQEACSFQIRSSTLPLALIV